MNRLSVRCFHSLFAACLTLAAGVATAAPIHIVAAENFYGALARAIGGSHVHVTSILSDPNIDPHAFESTASTARRVAHADLVLKNGLGYDDWMDHLLQVAAVRPGRRVITAADVIPTRPGDNPHLWYKPALWPALARRVARTLAVDDPADAGYYRANTKAFIARFSQVDQRIAQLKPRTEGVAVTATEPVFGYMAEALGFEMKNRAFQVAVMNNTTPSPGQVAAFEDSLATNRIRVLFYNRQVTDAATAHLLSIAQAHHVPIVGVTETMPAGQSPTGWFVDQLNALAGALGAAQ